MENTNINEIEQYLQEKMNPKERAAFEEKIETDDLLKTEVDFYQDMSTTIHRKRLINDAFAELEEEGFFQKEEIQQAEEKELDTSLTKKEAKIINIRHSNSRRILSYAASFLVLVVAGSLIFSNINYSNTALSSLNFEEIRTIEDRGSLKNAEVGIENPFEEGLLAMEQKNYLQAITFFQTIPQNTERYETAQLYLAYAQLEAGNTTTALQIAEQLTTQEKDEKISYRAEWFVLQILLQQDQVDAAFKERLNTFVQQNGAFKKDAEALQQQLNGFWRRLVL